MKTASKKTISLLLSVCLIALCAPVMALAYDVVEFTVVPDVTEADPGDTITYTVSMGPVAHMAGLQVQLGIPEGLTFGRLETDSSFMSKLEATDPSVLTVFNTFSLTLVIFSDNAAFDYTSDEPTTLMTFTCTADEGAAGEKTIALPKIEIANRTAGEKPRCEYDPAGSAVTVIAQLDAVKSDAKAELADYKDADDYRAAEQADLAAAIAAGNAAIDAAADSAAVAAALADAKAAIDEIKTDAQLAAEELAADKASFDAYKFDRIAAVQAMAQAGDSDAAAQIIAGAASDVALLDYDETKTLAGNKAAVDAIADIADALAAQRAADALAAQLADAKAGAKASLDNYVTDYSAYRPAQQDELTAAIAAGKDAIDAAADADSVAAALADAKAVIDAIKTDARLTAEEAAADTAAADAVEALIGAIGEVEYTDECKARIDAAQEAYDALTEDQKALVENAAVLNTAQERYASLKAQADKANRPAKSRICPLCGREHNKGQIDSIIGAMHRWIVFFTRLNLSILRLYP